MKYIRNTLIKPKRHSLRCHALLVHVDYAYFRVMRRLYRREWNWLCVNLHPWQRTRDHGVWRLTLTAYKNNKIHQKFSKQFSPPIFFSNTLYMCLGIHAKFRGDRPLRGRDLKGEIDPPPPPPPSKNLLSKSPVKIGLSYFCTDAPVQSEVSQHKLFLCRGSSPKWG